MARFQRFQKIGKMTASEIITLVSVCGTIVLGILTFVMAYLNYRLSHEARSSQFKQVIYGKQYEEYLDILRTTHKIVQFCQNLDAPESDYVEAFNKYSDKLSIWAGVMPLDTYFALMDFARVIKPFRGVIDRRGMNFSDVLKAELNIMETVRKHLGIEEINEQLTELFRTRHVEIERIPRQPV